MLFLARKGAILLYLYWWGTPCPASLSVCFGNTLLGATLNLYLKCLNAPVALIDADCRHQLNPGADAVAD